MDVERMRQTILPVYTSDAWKKRVKKMSSAQVFAIYIKFLKEGKIK